MVGKNDKEDVNEETVADKPQPKESAPAPFKVNDRVKRKEQCGCAGKVQEVRQETNSKSSVRENNFWMIKVLWDSGTCSYVDPEALEAL